MKFLFLMSCAVILTAYTSSAQHYSAIHGSSYSGGLGVYNNPASIVNAPYKWDVTIFGLQYQTITNAARGPNFPLNLSPTGQYDAAYGNYERFGDLNVNTRLLNTRISLDQDNAFAFGINLRGNTHLNTSRININDSIFGPRTFLFYNQANERLSIDLTSSMWMEMFLAYGRSIWNNETSRLNAGATLKIMKGLSGAFATVETVGIEQYVDNDQTSIRVAQGNGKYGYSANHGDGSSFSAGDLFSNSKLGFSVDLGMEYIIKSQAVSNIYDEASDQDYDWKFGFSLLDIGWNNFVHSSQNRTASEFVNNVNGEVLTEKFNTVENASAFNDSVSTIVVNFDTLSGNYKISNPTRLVLNVDRYVSGNLYVNAELSLNLAAGGKNNFAVREPRLLAVTPRWETRKLGFYLPVQVTRHGNFWVGGAVKAGPLLLGTHNLLNAFLKNKYIAGGAYLALTIRPVNIIRNKRFKQYECPEM